MRSLILRFLSASLIAALLTGEGWAQAGAAKGEWRFRLKAGNGEVIALASEGYSSKSAAQNGIDSIKRTAPDAQVVEV